MSELVPHIGRIADEICLVGSLQTDAVNHAPAQILMNTGSQQFGRPSFGSWTLYGLGSEAENLPGFVVLTSAKGTSGGASNYGSGFLPTAFGGIPLRSSGDPVLYLSNPRGIDRDTQRASLDTLNRLNDMAVARFGDPETAARIQAYEMAYKHQQSAPELMNLAMSRRRRSPGMASPIRIRPAMPATACSPGGCWSGAYGLCSSSTRPGISIET